MTPEVVLIKRDTWMDNGRPMIHETFEVRGGDIGQEWSEVVRIPCAPWCAVTIWNEDAKIFAYGGEVWPMAWPELFRMEGPRGRERHLLTEVGQVIFSAARQAVRP